MRTLQQVRARRKVPRIFRVKKQRRTTQALTTVRSQKSGMALVYQSSDGGVRVSKQSGWKLGEDGALEPPPDLRRVLMVISDVPSSKLAKKNFSSRLQVLYKSVMRLDTPLSSVQLRSMLRQGGFLIRYSSTVMSTAGLHAVLPVLAENFVTGLAAWRKDDGRHLQLRTMTDDQLWAILPRIYGAEHLVRASPARVRQDYPVRSPILPADAAVHGAFVPIGADHGEGWLEVKDSSIPGAGKGVFLRKGFVLYEGDYVTILQVDMKRGHQKPPPHLRCPVKVGSRFYRGYTYQDLLKLHGKGEMVGVGSLINVPRSAGKENVEILYHAAKNGRLNVMALRTIVGPCELFALYKLSPPVVRGGRVRL